MDIHGLITPNKDEKIKVFDPIRKKYVILTPEEIVRQGVIKYLIEVAHYPLGNISVEKTIKVHGLSKRYDVVVYGADFQPGMLVECKSQNIDVDEKLCKQISNYNLSLKAPYLWLTNGEKHFIYKIDFLNGNHCFQNELPTFNELNNFG